MNKKLTRILSGTLSLVFVGQVMIYGDGAAQGVLHADTIASAAEAIEEAKMQTSLRQSSMRQPLVSAMWNISHHRNQMKPGFLR